MSFRVIGNESRRIAFAASFHGESCMVPFGYVIGAVCLAVFVCGFLVWNRQMGAAFWKSALWDDVAPDADADDGPYALRVVAAEIPSDELERFRNADMVCLAVRETSYFGTRFFWVHEYETGRLQLQALMIELGITPQQLLPIFGRCSSSELVHDRDIGWDDLGGIPLKILGTGKYNEEPFRLFAVLLGKDISVELQSPPLGKVKQHPTKLFVVQHKEVVRAAS